GSLGIDLGGDGPTPNDTQDADAGPNQLQNFPVIQQAVSAGPNTVVTGTIQSTPNTPLTLDFYASASADPSGYGEGERWLASRTLTTDAAGDARYQYLLFAAATTTSELVTATATDAAGNTSEFSGAVATAQRHSKGGGSNRSMAIGSPLTATRDASASEGRSKGSARRESGLSDTTEPAANDAALAQFTAAEDGASGTSDDDWLLLLAEQEQDQTEELSDEALADGFDWLITRV
ncbi:MAG: hypothetical protein WD049_03325, partial [Candidatus Paceibacterota bacterium]